MGRYGSVLDNVGSEVDTMIKVNLIAIGKVKEDYFSKGIEEYAKRLKKYC